MQAYPTDRNPQNPDEMEQCVPEFQLTRGPCETVRRTPWDGGGSMKIEWLALESNRFSL